MDGVDVCGQTSSVISEKIGFHGPASNKGCWGKWGYGGEHRWKGVIYCFIYLFIENSHLGKTLIT